MHGGARCGPNISTSITDIDPAAWDALEAGGSPFLRHAFLAALESTWCVGGKSGWQAHAHNAARRTRTRRPRCRRTKRRIPLASSSSIFPGRRPYAQHGLNYYPKLVVGVPFTPAGGARLLVRPDLDASVMRRGLIAALREFAEGARVFVDPCAVRRRG